MESYSSIKINSNNLLIYAMMYTKLKNMLSVGSKTQRQDYVLYDSIYIKYKENKNHRYRKQTSGFLRLGVEWDGQWELMANREFLR